MAMAAIVLAGIAGLAVSLLGYEVALAERVLGQPMPDWFVATTGRVWLVLQALLVVAGVLGGLGSRRFSLAAIGIVAGLVFVTPVGLLTVVPTVLLLLLIAPNYGEFRQRWPGPARRPAGWTGP